ncbi:MAG: chorismate mutase [Solirubrobacterales bacterium]
MSVYALRGATTVEENDREAILEATREMLGELLERNSLSADDLVSAIFTVTDDLNAEFPALAAREMGLSAVPLLCAREIPVPGSMPGVIRVLVHYRAADGAEAQHVYLRRASELRSDLGSAQ